MEAELRNVKSQLKFLLWKRNYGTSKHNSLCKSEISDLNVTQYSICRSGTESLSIFLVRRWNYGTAELQDKQYSVCGTSSHSIFLMWKQYSGTSIHRIFYVRKRNFQSQNNLRVEYLWFLMQWPEGHVSTGPQAPGSKPSWWCCYLLFHLGGGPYWDFFVFSVIIKQ